jgi:hypothetical protein
MISEARLVIGSRNNFSCSSLWHRLSEWIARSSGQGISKIATILAHSDIHGTSLFQTLF